MKQYLDQQQTTKLIELGFEKPNEIYLSYFDSPKDFKSTNVIEINEDGNEIVLDNYSIGELIEMLPQYLEYKGGVVGIPIDYYSLTIRKNVVMYCDPYMDWVEIQCDDHKELIDNLYDMVTVLKEEGVI